MDLIFQIESLHVFQNEIQQLITSLYYSEKDKDNTKIESDSFEKAKQEMRIGISECNFDIQEIEHYFQNKAWQQEKLEYFQNLMRNHWQELLSAALNHYNSSHGDIIVNFDWFVKYVLGTSELKTLKYPLLQLILSTVNKTGQQNNVMYDINKDKLLKMINVLESNI